MNPEYVSTNMNRPLSNEVPAPVQHSPVTHSTFSQDTSVPKPSNTSAQERKENGIKRAVGGSASGLGQAVRKIEGAGEYIRHTVLGHVERAAGQHARADEEFRLAHQGEELMITGKRQKPVAAVDTSNLDSYPPPTQPEGIPPNNANYPAPVMDTTASHANYGAPPPAGNVTEMSAGTPHMSGGAPHMSGAAPQMSGVNAQTGQTRHTGMMGTAGGRF